MNHEKICRAFLSLFLVIVVVLAVGNHSASNFEDFVELSVLGQIKIRVRFVYVTRSYFDLLTVLAQIILPYIFSYDYINFSFLHEHRLTRRK